MLLLEVGKEMIIASRNRSNTDILISQSADRLSKIAVMIEICVEEQFAQFQSVIVLVGTALNEMYEQMSIFDVFSAKLLSSS
ncbi:hypothetical protein A0256_01010 [Mucilaginibacter sp. PAMC 26640]|nr:hypothetical protein A0256_01010 [Mucilaginibacter sp. PAMC 26640]